MSARHLAAGVIVAALLACGCRPKAASTPPMLELKEVMAHVMDAGADDFWSSSRSVVNRQGEVVSKPETQEAWDRIENGAATVATTTVAIKTPFYARAPLASWYAHADRVAALAVQGRDAARTRDLARLAAVGEALDEACESCHREFDPATREGVEQLRSLMTRNGFKPGDRGFYVPVRSGARP